MVCGRGLGYSVNGAHLRAGLGNGFVDRNIRIVTAVGGVAAGLLWLISTLVLAPRPHGSTSIVTAPGGHAYQFVAAPGLSWSAAEAAAERQTWQGRRGYLATIDSAVEFQFILNRVVSRDFPDVTYVGGRQVAPGEWRWVTGPDGKADGGRGRLFWRGDRKGRPPPGGFADWMTTAFQKGGKWDTANVCCVTLFSYGVPQFSTSLGNGDSQEHIAGYFVEFGE